ncbi:hypothetical protein CF386_07430 [Paraphotobacterium marinum]|uniref:EamA domain-containing protein n=1 Tax=Paraphotobacterium marinum TaxID=1755811 RepID=A0A220VF14_9GAMM|nr:DMT family transporter [Paraphotobacterium marinum]ASK78891.1 hypothetical protein CF386_07430 [Paraphotobacterium marinum]
MSNRSHVFNTILLIVLSIIWGSQFALNSIVLESVPPFFLATARVMIGAITLCILTIFFEKKETYVKHKSVALNKKLLILYVLIAILETLIPMTAITYGQSQNVPSSITGILMGTIPLFVILLSYFFYPKEEKKVVTLLSILVGFVGLIVLFIPKLVLNEQHSLMGEFFVLLGAFSFALSLVLIGLMPPKLSPLRMTRNILLISSTLMLIILMGTFPKISITDWMTYFWIIILGVFASGVGYFIYVKLVEKAGVTYTSFTNYVAPLISTLIGILFLKEAFEMTTLFALILILFALILKNFSEWNMLLTIKKLFGLKYERNNTKV